MGGRTKTTRGAAVKQATCYCATNVKQHSGHCTAGTVVQIVAIFTMEGKSCHSKTNHKLKIILRERELKVSGKKTDLIDVFIQPFVPTFQICAIPVSSTVQCSL